MKMVWQQHHKRQGKAVSNRLPPKRPPIIIPCPSHFLHPSSSSSSAPHPSPSPSNDNLGDVDDNDEAEDDETFIKVFLTTPQPRYKRDSLGPHSNCAARKPSSASSTTTTTTTTTTITTKPRRNASVPRVAKPTATNVSGERSCRQLNEEEGNEDENNVSTNKETIAVIPHQRPNTPVARTRFNAGGTVAKQTRPENTCESHSAPVLALQRSRGSTRFAPFRPGRLRRWRHFGQGDAGQKVLMFCKDLNVKQLTLQGTSYETAATQDTAPRPQSSQLSNSTHSLSVPLRQASSRILPDGQTPKPLLGLPELQMKSEETVRLSNQNQKVPCRSGSAMYSYTGNGFRSTAGANVQTSKFSMYKPGLMCGSKLVIPSQQKPAKTSLIPDQSNGAPKSGFSFKIIYNTSSASMPSISSDVSACENSHALSGPTGITYRGQSTWEPFWEKSPEYQKAVNAAKKENTMDLQHAKGGQLANNRNGSSICSFSNSRTFQALVRGHQAPSYSSQQMDHRNSQVESKRENFYSCPYFQNSAEESDFFHKLSMIEESTLNAQALLSNGETSANAEQERTFQDSCSATSSLSFTDVPNYSDQGEEHGTNDSEKTRFYTKTVKETCEHVDKQNTCSTPNTSRQGSPRQKCHTPDALSDCGNTPSSPTSVRSSPSSVLEDLRTLKTGNQDRSFDRLNSNKAKQEFPRRSSPSSTYSSCSENAEDDDERQCTVSSTLGRSASESQGQFLCPSKQSNESTDAAKETMDSEGNIAPYNSLRRSRSTNHLHGKRQSLRDSTSADNAGKTDYNEEEKLRKGKVKSNITEAAVPFDSDLKKDGAKLNSKPPECRICLGDDTSLNVSINQKCRETTTPYETGSRIWKKNVQRKHMLIQNNNSNITTYPVKFLLHGKKKDISTKAVQSSRSRPTSSSLDFSTSEALVSKEPHVLKRRPVSVPPAFKATAGVCTSKKHTGEPALKSRTVSAKLRKEQSCTQVDSKRRTFRIVSHDGAVSYIPEDCNEAHEDSCPEASDQLCNDFIDCAENAVTNNANAEKQTDESYARDSKREHGHTVNDVKGEKEPASIDGIGRSVTSPNAKPKPVTNSQVLQRVGSIKSVKHMYESTSKQRAASLKAIKQMYESEPSQLFNDHSKDHGITAVRLLCLLKHKPVCYTNKAKMSKSCTTNSTETIHKTRVEYVEDDIYESNDMQTADITKGYVSDKNMARMSKSVTTNSTKTIRITSVRDVEDEFDKHICELQNTATNTGKAGDKNMARMSKSVTTNATKTIRTTSVRDVEDEFDKHIDELQNTATNTGKASDKNMARMSKSVTTNATKTIRTTSVKYIEGRFDKNNKELQNITINKGKASDTHKGGLQQQVRESNVQYKTMGRTSESHRPTQLPPLTMRFSCNGETEEYDTDENDTDNLSKNDTFRKDGDKNDTHKENTEEYDTDDEGDSNLNTYRENTDEYDTDEEDTDKLYAHYQTTDEYDTWGEYTDEHETDEDNQESGKPDGRSTVQPRNAEQKAETPKPLSDAMMREYCRRLTNQGGRTVSMAMTRAIFNWNHDYDRFSRVKKRTQSGKPFHNRQL